MEGEQKKTQAIPKNQIRLKCSLKHHSPEEIYDYLSKHVGELGMKIKKKQAIIGFEDCDFYEKVLKEHRTVMLRGKRIDFVAFPKSEENYLVEEEEAFDLSKQEVNPQYPEFRATNRVEAKIHTCKVEMMDKVQELFMPTVEVARERMTQIHLEMKDEGPRQRELQSLQGVIVKKMKLIQGNYCKQVQKVNKYISEFSMKPKTIDLEPTFKIDSNWNFPKITEKNMGFVPASFFKCSQSALSCKRLCAINRKQFAVTTIGSGNKGFLKIYDVNQSNAKEDLAVENGPYGICLVNNFLLLGGIDSTIKHLNLEDNERIVENSKTLSDRRYSIFSDIKIFKKSEEKPSILALCNDENLRIFDIEFEEITAGLFTLSFDKQKIIGAPNCKGFDLINEQSIAYTGLRKITKRNVQKNITKDICLSDDPLKVKKFNENIFAVASLKTVEFVDLRSDMVVQKFINLPAQLKCMEVIGQHSIMIGGKAFMGLIDDRRHKELPWKAEDARHKVFVTDILMLEDRIISCDAEGRMYAWKLNEEKVESFWMGPAPEKVEFKLQFKRR